VSLRVLHLIDGLGVGGAERLLADLVRAARTVDVDVSVAHLYEKDGSPAAARLRALGVEPVHVRASGLLHPASLLAVRRLVAAQRPDVVHTHLGYSDLLGGLAARSVGVPTVATIHVTTTDESVRERVKVALIGAVRRRSAARVIAVSEAARAAAVASRWSSAERTVTVHNGIEGRAVPGAGRGVRGGWGLAPDTPVVGMVSVLRGAKGHAEAFEALRAVRARLPAARLVVVGDGPARDDVACAARPLGDAVVLAGYRDDVMQVLDAFDVLVHPSHHEAFPTALLEALAAGVPVVATAVGGVPEIVTPEVGALVDAPPQPDVLARALLDLLGDDVARRRAGAAARRRFEAEFSLEHWGAALRDVYDAVIGEHRARRLTLATRGRRRRGT
jgi:glycosyltransferase involved in cell wall biosynthesis